MPTGSLESTQKRRVALSYHLKQTLRLLSSSPKASDLQKIERLQERDLKAVYKDHHATYSELVDRARLPTLKNRCLQDVCTLMIKVKHKLCPAYISNIFNTHITSYSLRQTDFSIPRYNT